MNVDEFRLCNRQIVHACLDVALSLTIIGTYAYVLYRAVMPEGALVFSALALIVGVVLLVHALTGLRRWVVYRAAVERGEVQP